MSTYDVIVVGAGNAALAAAVSASENGAKRIVVIEKAPREMRGGNTHWSGGVLRFAYDDPREIGELLPDVEDEFENFYDGISPYSKDDYHGDLMRVTSGRTDPVLSKVLVHNSFDTVKWMKKVGGIKMEPAITLSAVKKDNVMVIRTDPNGRQETIKINLDDQIKGRRGAPFYVLPYDKVYVR